MNKKRRMKAEMETLCDLRKDTCSPQNHSGIYVGLEHIDTGSFVLAKYGKTSQVRSAKSRFYPGDVLYGKLRPYLDKAVVTEAEGICSTDILVLKPCGVPSWFLCGILHTDKFIEHAKQTTHGVNHPRTSWAGIKGFEIIAFPLPEQKKIAAVLLKIQKAIETQGKIIQSLRDLKKSTMQHLFTHGLRGEKTKMTEVGEIPESWEVRKNDSVFKLSSGKTRPQNIISVPSSNKPFPVYGGNGIMGYSSEWFIDDEVLILGRVGEHCGAVHVANGKTWISDNALYSRDWLAPDVSLTYVAVFLDYLGLNRFRRKSSQPLITQGVVSQLPLPVPNTKEQEYIVESLSLLEQSTKTHKSKKSALQKLFKTTLNKLMTGEIRVGNLGIDVKEVET